MSTIFHHPEGHHGSALCNDCGDAEAETLCCIVSSESALGHCAEVFLLTARLEIVQSRNALKSTSGRRSSFSKSLFVGSSNRTVACRMNRSSKVLCRSI